MVTLSAAEKKPRLSLKRLPFLGKECGINSFLATNKYEVKAGMREKHSGKWTHVLVGDVRLDQRSVQASLDVLQLFVILQWKTTAQSLRHRG